MIFFLNWKLEAGGQFSIKSAYLALSLPIHKVAIPNPLFQKVSLWKGPARIRSHLWKIVHGCMLTNELKIMCVLDLLLPLKVLCT